MKTTIICIAFFFSGLFLSAGNSDVKVIKEPEPLFSGLSNAKTLVLEKTIENIADKELQVLAGIKSTAVDKSGNYYLFDFKHGAIIKLNREFKFIKTIGSKGEGPGEFRIRGMTPNHLSVGLNEKLYLVNWLGRRIYKYSLEGKYINELKYEQFNGFRLAVDARGTLVLPSIKSHIIDIHDSNMKYKKSLIPISELRTFLFFKPPACVIIKFAIPGFSNIRYEWLSTNDLMILNNYDLSLTLVNPATGKIQKKFYAWDDYILAEYKKKIKRTLEAAIMGSSLVL